MKKITSLILILVMCLTALIACTTTEDPNNPSGGTTDPNGEVGGTTAGDDPNGTTDPNGGTTAPIVYDYNPTVGNLQGETVRILAWQDAENIEFEYDENNTDQATINDAILERNTAVKSNLNCELEFFYTPGNYNNYSAYVKKAEAYANGDEGEFMDILAAYSMTTANASTKGLCANLIPLQKENGLDFTKPWWPQTMVEEAMFDNMLFLCTGDISTNLLWMMETMYFSKDLLVTLKSDENAPKELYKLAEEGGWTIDKFFEYCTDVYSDISGDGKSGAGDQIGYAISWTGYYDDFYVGAGFNMCERDSAGKLVISDEWGREREGNFAGRLVDFTYTDDFYSGSETNTMFQTGLVLFKNDRAKFAKTAREKAEIEYGILPMPKLDTLQANYSTNLGFPHTLYAISSASSQLENAALVLESMAAEGYLKVTPVLFEDALKLRYSPELEDAMMFDILRSTCCFDVGRMYCKSLNDYSWATFRDTVSKGSSSYSTKIERIRPNAQELVDKLIEDLSAAGA